MEHVGIDVHKNQSQICIFTEAGEVLHQRIHTNRERFAAVFAERPTARILIEASTESEWVAQCLEALGHEVIVADPNKYPPAEPEVLRLLAPRRGLTAIEKSKSKTEWTTNGIIPELSNFGSPPAEPGVYLD
jgi:hypothetical protein